ncbi:hypothetical protein BT96DRAFT_930173 [Gymnopus androsaceus JB14]|uniref:Uncharacterized protein n=1 Tax=Gymnopus androsaceus JB14 TaxID=1447944 RepID=A0A6A4GB86_9AGAR|nr:hypothetical protein BT96DRAFT_930173 [Gymnopus androsaceus JB14]
MSYLPSSVIKRLLWYTTLVYYIAPSWNIFRERHVQYFMENTTYLSLLPVFGVDLWNSTSMIQRSLSTVVLLDGNVSLLSISIFAHGASHDDIQY